MTQRTRARFLILTLAALIVLGASMSAEQNSGTSQAGASLPLPYRLGIISSSHQDIAWMDSPEACRKFRDEHCITPALEMMRKNPDYRFVMENMLNLLEYIETHPDRRAEIERYTREGRLEWGATFNQPYESLMSGEELVRETYFGRRWIRKNMPGCDATIYFNPDVPGRALQMQQILSKAGIPYMVISRFHEGYYRWLSPDGSGVLAFTPGHYGNSSALLHAKGDEGLDKLTAKLQTWGPYYKDRSINPIFPLLNSEDFSQPTDFGPLIARWNALHGSASPASRMGYSSAREFFEALSKGSPVFKDVMGERPNLWLYIHGPTHHWAVTAHREAGYLLPAAEMFSTFAALLAGDFSAYPAREFNEAWQAAIYPDHGWGGKEGQVTDRLFRKKYELARDTGRNQLDRALTVLAGRVAVDAGRGLPIIVFNSLSWPAAAPVTVTLKKPAGHYIIKDARGNEIPSQALPAEPDQARDTLRLQFVASAVPALGYKTYYSTDAASASVTATIGVSASPTVTVLENAFYKITLAPGGLKSVFDKSLGRELLRTDKFLGFEVFTLQSVGNGAGEFGRVQQPTMEGFDKLSAHAPQWARVDALSGRVKTVYALVQPLKNCALRQRLIVYNEIKRIDVEVDILGWDGDPYREFRLAVPVAAPGGKVSYEVPMGVVEVGTSEAPGTGGPAYGTLNYDEEMSKIRPREVQNFMNVSDGGLGLTLSTCVAVNDFEDPTTDPAGYPILQPILLASRRSCHSQGNWYLQEGDHHYAFSLTSHEPGWRNGYKTAIQANVGLFPIVRPAASGTADLPAALSFVKLSAPNVLISTVKKAEDDDSVIVRGYEIEGRDVRAELAFFAPLARAAMANIIEDEGRTLSIEKDESRVSLAFGHQAIETIKLFPAKARDRAKLALAKAEGRAKLVPAKAEARKK
jgi:alpha-mannosidase